MTPSFQGPLAGELKRFLTFMRTRGYRYDRAAFMLRSFDRYLALHARKERSWRFDEVTFAWLASRPNRKSISVAMDLSVVRQFWRYLHRLNPRQYDHEPLWPTLPSEPRFVAHIFR